MSCHTPATGWCRPFTLAARAAAKVAPDEIAQLGVILDEHQNAIAADDMERVADLGQAFHRAINQAADSPVPRSCSSPWSRIYRTASTPRSRAGSPPPAPSVTAARRPAQPPGAQGEVTQGAAHPRGRRPPDRGPRGAWPVERAGSGVLTSR
ncbi:FCD domain-containing protein [Streptomyces sp. NPDC059893]|uniref:FCD domain-containing protein n=1 Tax=Streptomyces sp. NPDC059893 TaxID=3346990 RepID=UPI0036624FA3